MRATAGRLIVFAAAAALLAACGGSEVVDPGGGPTASETPDGGSATPDDGGPAAPLGQEATGLEEVQAHLTAAAARWHERGLTSYTLTYIQRCFCPVEEVTVTVADGHITSVDPVNTQEPLTADGIFARVQEALDDGPDAIRATFDADTGMLMALDVDVMMNAIDDEWGLEVRIEVA